MGGKVTHHFQGESSRPKYPIFNGPAPQYAYYYSSKIGKCKSCGLKTNYWLINMKEKGRFMCLDCKNKAHISYK